MLTNGPSIDLGQWQSALPHPSRTEILVGGAIFILSLTGSIVATIYVLCRLPRDYLVRHDHISLLHGRPRWQQILGRIGKNIAGVVLVLLGIVLSMPGVPGQGLLTILIGVMLIDMPRKREFERRLMGRPALFTTINRIRARFGHEALEHPSKSL